MPADKQSKAHMRKHNYFAATLHDWKRGQLHHGLSGQKVTDQKTAIAIAFSIQRKHNEAMRKKHGKAGWKKLAAKHGLSKSISGQDTALLSGILGGHGLSGGHAGHGT